MISTLDAYLKQQEQSSNKRGRRPEHFMTGQIQSRKETTAGF